MTLTGWRELDDRLSRLRTGAGIAIERGEGLLVERLQHKGYRLFCVSPKMSARARERYRMAPVKSDAFDAFVLADSLRHEHRHWRSLAVPSALLAELRALTRDRERLIWNQRDVENQLRAIVDDLPPGGAWRCSPAWTATSAWRSCATTRRRPGEPSRDFTDGGVLSVGTATPDAPNPRCS